MIRPPFLRPGDTIGIAAPASSLTEAELTAGIEMIRSWGYRVVTGRNLYRHGNSFAGTDAQRAADFQEMLDDPAIHAIVCARGGYGTVRIIRQLDFTRFLQHPKWVAGCSDITVLHARLQQLGVESLHSAMPRKVPPAVPDLASMDALRAALEGEIREYRIPPHPKNIAGTAEGILLGGNLSVLYSLAGSDLEPDFGGAIVFLEDVGEYLYHIDRMLMNYTLRNRLAGVKGMIIGSFNDMKISGSGFRTPAYDILRRYATPPGIPVLFGFPAGHEERNMAVYLGRRVVLDTHAGMITFP